MNISKHMDAMGIDVQVLSYAHHRLLYLIEFDGYFEGKFELIPVNSGMGLGFLAGFVRTR